MTKEEADAALDRMIEDRWPDLLYLYNRWEDESGYESIDEYRQFIQKLADSVDNLGKVIAMHTDPFGFMIDIDGHVFKVEVNAYMIMSRYSHTVEEDNEIPNIP